MIKGRYVATIVLDICFDENEPNVRDFEEMKMAVTGGELDKAIAAMLSEDICGGFAAVGLNRQYADLYRVDGGTDNGE